MKKKTIHHIVYSTKGGCGKTAFSLCLEVSDLKKLLTGVIGENFSEWEGVNYLLDLDFLGTSLMHCFGDKKLITMQNLIFDNENIEKMRKACKAEFGENIFIVPAEADEAKKTNFHVKRKNTPLLKYDEFRYEIAALQRNIELAESVGENNKAESGDEKDKIINIIYDMPPNSDGYTEAFFEEVFELAERDKKKQDNKIILYLVYNSDSMLLCNLGWLETFLTGNHLRECEVVLVSNRKFLDSTVSIENERNTLDSAIKARCLPCKNVWLYFLERKECIRVFYQDKTSEAVKSLYPEIDKEGIKFLLSEMKLSPLTPEEVKSDKK